MLIYVESKAFPFTTSHRTFVIRASVFETVARIRAQILHVLYELGREDHQFRLRYKGQYLRDAYTIEDYGIIDNAIIKMIPLSRQRNAFQSLVDVGSECPSSVSERETVGPGILPDIKQALQKEVRIFDQREEIIYHFKSLLYFHFLAIILCFPTTYWYSGFWTLALWIFAAACCPVFTRANGFMGRQSVYKNHFCIAYGLLALMCMAVALYFSAEEWTRVVRHGCKDWTFVDDCSHQAVYSAVFFCVHAVVLLASACLAWRLLWNMKVEYGDYVEQYLVQSRDIEDVMRAARDGRTKEKRIAAFELATMATSSDDNKFRIVAEGGLEVLIQMALSSDPSTQEHAVEAIAELLTVPAIQDNLVEMGGLRTLSALLHSRDQRVVYQAATAISYVTSDCQETMATVTAEHGLDDLAFAAGNSNVTNQRIVAGIFLELAFNSDIRAQMAARNSPAQALIKLCRSPDPDTQRYALQTLELLAIESPDMICAQEGLLQLLLELPASMFDSKVLILAGKILLYFAENQETCEAMLGLPRCQESLFKYARTKDPILQKVVAKVIYCMADVRELAYRARHLEMGDILKFIRDNAADREAWDMADQALQFLNSDGDHGIGQLPALSTAEKLDKMAASRRPSSGSKGSMGSRVSLRSNLSLDSTAGIKKGL